MIPAWPKWIAELEGYELVDWTTSKKAPVGQVHILAITKTGDGILDYADDPRVDALHSIWRTTSPTKLIEGSRWPVQAEFKNLVVFQTPVPKTALLAAGLIKARWPQSPSSGKLFSGSDLQRLTELIAATNPRQAKAIRTALLPLP